MDNFKRKPRKQKVLLMGKSGSGKSSMRSIIFSNYVAKDVRRLGATIDVEHSKVKFLGNLILNLWDCGGQDAFTENYLTSQKPYVFSEVGVLIYVFDIESREFEQDLTTYSAVINALQEYSPRAAVFCLVHKMDLVQIEYREKLLRERTDHIRQRSESFKRTVQTYGTSIWDQTLYRAWGNIVHRLIPNLDTIEDYLSHMVEVLGVEEIILFERATFLTVTSITSDTGDENPYYDRYERLSNIIKTFKHSLANFTNASASAHLFSEFFIKTPHLNLVLSRLTSNTYVLVVLPPGECEMECTRLGILSARNEFANLDIMDGSERESTDGGYDQTEDRTSTKGS